MRILVIRTSAMGDVALVATVIKAINEQYPGVSIILLTRPAYRAFFESYESVTLFLTSFKERHKGIFGLFRIVKEITELGKVDHVIDLHDVLRSKVLRLFFRFGGVPVSVINKGRAEKRRLIKGRNNIRLKHSVERYVEVFKKAGFPLNLTAGPWIAAGERVREATIKKTGFAPFLNIGVAPYAKHQLKMWPEENMVRLLNLIAARSNAHFWLFGGKEEAERLDRFAEKVPGAVSLAGSLSLSEEIALIGELSFMIAMDSSNMHMAALSGTKVISIWGGTDPSAGFGAWMQPDEYFMRIPREELTCRPCTVFGKGTCRRGDFACMNWLTPERIFEKIVELKLLDNR